jgi:hypothetical protein
LKQSLESVESNWAFRVMVVVVADNIILLSLRRVLLHQDALKHGEGRVAQPRIRLGSKLAALCEGGQNNHLGVLKGLSNRSESLTDELRMSSSCVTEHGCIGRLEHYRPCADINKHRIGCKSSAISL